MNTPPMELEQEIIHIASAAKAASRELLQLSPEQKNKILLAMAEALKSSEEQILAANRIDLELGEKAGLSSALMDRLRLTAERIKAMADGIQTVALLTDPIGVSLSESVRPNGLRIQKMRVPIGVIAIIYESRPNVTADSAVLCLKASNAVILRGGSEAIESNKAIAAALTDAGKAHGLPDGALQFISTPDRDAVKILLQQEDFLDLVIPRGGEGLIRAVSEMSRVPVIRHYKGVCHVYVEQSADLEAALRIVENAKCQRPGVCNAMETLLVDAAIAERFIPVVTTRLQEEGVEIRGDEAVCKLVKNAKLATEQDWFEEYLDLVLSVRIVSNVEQAVEHINFYGSHHSDAILSNNKEVLAQFVRDVDSAVVYQNASTRFTDGGEFGMGAEIGISTDKIHARGPMGVEELTTYKYVVTGSGQVRG